MIWKDILYNLFWKNSNPCMSSSSYSSSYRSTTMLARLGYIMQRQSLDVFAQNRHTKLYYAVRIVLLLPDYMAILNIIIVAASTYTYVMYNTYMTSRNWVAFRVMRDGYSLICCILCYLSSAKNIYIFCS